MGQTSGTGEEWSKEGGHFGALCDSLRCLAAFSKLPLFGVFCTGLVRLENSSVICDYFLYFVTFGV